MATFSIIDIIIKWTQYRLSQQGSFEIVSGDLHEDIKAWAFDKLGILHNADIYSRWWRHVRANKLLGAFGIGVVEIPNTYEDERGNVKKSRQKKYLFFTPLEVYRK